MSKISLYSENTNPSANDFVLGDTASGPTTNRFKLLNILALFAPMLTDVQYFTLAGVTKTAYSTSAWTTYSTQSYTPNIDGTLVVNYSCIFGFHTVESTGDFRIVINDGSTDTIISVGSGNALYAAAAAFTPITRFGQTTVTGSAPYTIKLQTRGNTTNYDNHYYIEDQALLCTVYA